MMKLLYRTIFQAVHNLAGISVRKLRTCYKWWITTGYLKIFHNHNKNRKSKGGATDGSKISKILQTPSNTENLRFLIPEIN